MGVVTFTFSYSQGAKFWLNRATMYSFSFCWWPSVLEQIDNGYIMHGLGPAAGYSVQLTLKPEFWDWSSNTYSLDYIVDSAFARDPLGNIIFGFQPVSCTLLFDPVFVFPIIRFRGGPFVGEVEHVFPIGAGGAGFWRKPPGQLVALPQTYPIVR